MGTRRRHRRRYRGGEEFIERPFVMPTGVKPTSIGTLKAKHLASEKARYEAWKAKREVEARAEASAREASARQDIEKGKEEDAKMASFNKKRGEERKKELDDLRKLEQERRERLQEESNPCMNILKQAGITGTPDEMKKAYRRFSLKNHPDKGGDTATFQTVSDCYDKTKVGAGRKTRRRKSRRRR